MRRIIFLRGLLKIPAYLSACPSGEIPCRCHVCMGSVAAADAHKHFPSPVRLLAVPTGRAGHTRPGGVLRPYEDTDFFRDLRAPCSKMLPGPTADRPVRSKISQRLWALYNQDSPGSGRKRYGLSRFAVKQLFDCRPRRFLMMSLPLLFLSALYRLVHHGTQRLRLIPIRPGHANVHADITGNDISGQHRLDLGELDKDPRDQPALLPLAHLTGRPELSPTSQGVLEGAVRLGRHGGTRRRLDPVGKRRTLRFLNLGVTEQGKVCRTVKRFTRGFFRREARVDNAARPLLRLIGNPAQTCRALRVALFRVGSLVEVFPAVVQRVQPVPIRGIPRLLRLAGVGFDLERIGADYSGRFRHGRLFGFFNFSRGTFQFGEWHVLLGQTVGFGMRGSHV